MAIKDWKKKKIKDGVEWKKKFKYGWYKIKMIKTSQSSVYEQIHNFDGVPQAYITSKTKSQALKKAKAYMKKH